MGLLSTYSAEGRAVYRGHESMLVIIEYTASIEFVHESIAITGVPEERLEADIEPEVDLDSTSITSVVGLVQE